MPRIDDGPTDGPPGRQLTSACVDLSAAEALELLDALTLWAEDVAEGSVDPDWHTHITGADGSELTISIRVEDRTPERP